MKQFKNDNLHTQSSPSVQPMSILTMSQSQVWGL